jgi:hypothetical protein
MEIQNTSGTKQIYFPQSGNSYFNNGGNLGIGITSPSQKLHVNGTIQWGGGTATPYAYSGIDGSGLYIEQVGNSTATENIRLQASRTGDGSNYSQLHIDPTSGFSFMQNGTANGNVGIGVPNPSSRLCVNGTIRAKEVIVTTQGWPDRVFKKGYDLKPLQEVEKYIKKNSRLEGIPSEKEVMAKGVPMGEMQAKLLQKLEETTLYLIEMKKENEQLKARLAAIEQKVR